MAETHCGSEFRGEREPCLPNVLDRVMGYGFVKMDKDFVKKESSTWGWLGVKSCPPS